MLISKLPNSTDLVLKYSWFSPFFSISTTNIFFQTCLVLVLSDWNSHFLGLCDSSLVSLKSMLHRSGRSDRSKRWANDSLRAKSDLLSTCVWPTNKKRFLHFLIFLIKGECYFVTHENYMRFSVHKKSIGPQPHFFVYLLSVDVFVL